MGGAAGGGSGIQGEPALSQGGDAEVNQRADVAHTRFQSFADLFVAQTSFELQSHGFALFLRELMQPLADLLCQFLRLQFRGGPGGVRGFLVENFEVHGDEALMFALVVQRPVSADGEEPRCQSVLVQRRQALAQLDKDILGDVACLVDFSNDAKRIAYDGALVAFERGEEERVIRVAMAHEMFSGHHGGWDRFFEKRRKLFCDAW